MSANSDFVEVVPGAITGKSKDRRVNADAVLAKNSERSVIDQKWLFNHRSDIWKHGNETSMVLGLTASKAQTERASRALTSFAQTFLVEDKYKYVCKLELESLYEAVVPGAIRYARAAGKTIFNVIATALTVNDNLIVGKRYVGGIRFLTVYEWGTPTKFNAAPRNVLWYEIQERLVNSAMVLLRVCGVVIIVMFTIIMYLMFLFQRP